MNTPKQPTDPVRQSLMGQIAAIQTMLPGTLAEEYRPSSSARSKHAKPLGPYFKHQFWKDGHNVSRRVPAHQATQLREDIDNAKRFNQLTTQLAQFNTEHTLALRAAEASATTAAAPDAKKNSTKQPAAKSSTKPKPSSPKPKQT
jgi:hypothetical protein